MRIIVAHPGKQHSFRLASALKKSGNLLFYCTEVYNNQKSFLLKIIKHFLSKDNLKRVNNRRNQDLDENEVIQIGELKGLFETLLYRIDRTSSKILYETLRKHNANKFGLKVAKLAIKNNADMVIMYDSNATKGFKYLKKNAPEIKRVLDVSIAARPYLKKIYSEEMELSNKMDLFRENKTWWSSKQQQFFMEEITDSNFFLVASTFVQESLEYCGVKREQILLVPYGANVKSSYIHKSNNEKPLEVLFVGQVTYRKGITYLLNVISQFSDSEVHLSVVGAYNPNDWYIKEYSQNPKITFRGLLTLDEMVTVYNDADVFVIDSIAEGMAQVGIEAMACGLPVICSHNSGVDDIVHDGVNGFVIPCYDIVALKEKIDYFTKNREKAVEMGIAGREIARNYTWEKYEKNIVEALYSIE